MKSFAELKAEREQAEAARIAALDAERAGRAPGAPAQTVPGAAAPSAGLSQGEKAAQAPPRRIVQSEPTSRPLPATPEAQAPDNRQLELGGSSNSAAPQEPVESPPQRAVPSPAAVAAPPASARSRPTQPEGPSPIRDLAMTEEQRDAYWADERRDEEADRNAEAERRVMERLNKEGRLKPARKSGKKSAGKTADSVPMSRVRDIPTCLVERAKQLFPSERTGDSVAAYLYMGEGCPDDLVVTPAIQELVKRFSSKTVTLETVQSQMAKELQRLQTQQRYFTAKLEAVELAVAYAALRAAGFSVVDPQSPDTMDFLVKGVEELMGRLELQAGLKHQRDIVREGRPRRGASRDREKS